MKIVVESAVSAEFELRALERELARNGIVRRTIPADRVPVDDRIVDFDGCDELVEETSSVSADGPAAS
jgi:hypothetical protein